VNFEEVISQRSKVKSVEDVIAAVSGKKVVFTNGCFDILHAGHVDMLRYAKSKGDILVVGVNSDSSIKRLKGENRPINNFTMRALVLSAIEYIDYIICFEEDTPADIIQRVNPDVLIKGGDYTVENIVGANYVLSHGGVVESMPFNYNVSTTKILAHNG